MTDYRAYFNEHWAMLQQAPLFGTQPNPTFRNPPFEAASFRVLIVRLSPFRDVSRSTPHLFLYQAARRGTASPDAVCADAAGADAACADAVGADAACADAVGADAACADAACADAACADAAGAGSHPAYIDMAFFPPEHDRARFLKAGIPLLVGTQSRRDAREFDLVLISNAYSLELINLPYLLIHSGMPVLAGERDASWPLIILGGSNALASQALLAPGGDAVVDALFFGEGEREVETLVRRLYTGRSLPKAERLRQAAASVTGLWVAGGPADQVVEKSVCQLPEAADLLVDYPSLNSEEASTARLQTSFGCPAFCSFCFEGYERKPYRETELDEVLATAAELKRRHGVEAVDVYSFNFNTHSDILALLLELNRRFDRVNVLSQRVDLLAVMPSLMEAEIKADKRSFTLGIEGISARSRAFLHKSLSDGEIESVLSRLLQARVRDIKLFYILTGHELEDDLAEFHAFVLRLKGLRQTHNRGMRITFSFGLLIRMPFTPLRHDRLLLEEAAWRPIIGAVKSSCETNGFEFRLAMTWEEYATSQVLALGGTWLHAPLLALAREGHLYDVHLTPGYWDALRRWMVAEGHWTESFLGEKGADWPFALDFVRFSVPRAFLYAQYRDAVDGIDRGYCLGEVGGVKGEGDPGHCLGCGACTTPEERAAITTHAIRHPGYGYLAELEETVRAKWRIQPLHARFRLPVQVAGAEPAWINAFVTRSLLARYPELGPELLSVQEAVFTTKANAPRYSGVWGETLVGIRAWHAAALGVLTEGEVLPGGLIFEGFVPAFVPGQFERMRVRLVLSLAHFPDAGPRLRRYLQDQYVPVNLRRLSTGELAELGSGSAAITAAYRFEIPEKARKKRVLFEGLYVERDGRFEAELVVSPKFDFVDYMRSLSEPARAREVRVEVRDLVI
jgi:hypothetical protein